MTADLPVRRRNKLISQLGRTKNEQESAILRLAQCVDSSVVDDHWLRAIKLAPPPAKVRELFVLVEATVQNPKNPPSGGDQHWAHWIENLGSDAIDLATAAEAKGLSWCDPGNDPFVFHTNAQWFERVQETARRLDRRGVLERNPRDQTHLVVPSVEILMCVFRRTAIAWVGHGSYGIAVEIDRQNLNASGETSSPGFRTAAGLALAWYIDVSFPSRSGIPMMTATATEQWTGSRYQPSRDFVEHVGDVRAGRKPAFAHWVVSHVRTLPTGTPDPDHVATAPVHLRSHMGPSDTWVRGHVREGSNIDALLNHLLSTPSIADAIGASFVKQ